MKKQVSTNIRSNFRGEIITIVEWSSNYDCLQSAYTQDYSNPGVSLLWRHCIPVGIYFSAILSKLLPAKPFSVFIYFQSILILRPGSWVFTPQSVQRHWKLYMNECQECVHCWPSSVLYMAEYYTRLTQVRDVRVAITTIYIKINISLIYKF